MNYYDILLAKKLEDDRDLKVEGLSVTANGTYSEEGKVYKPVVVNVAGYSLKDMPSGAISSFNDGAALPLNNLKISIEPVQSGSGDPSPTNVRPISGHTEANVVVSPTTDAEDGTTYTIQFTDGTNPLTVYGGTLDVVSGELVVDRVSVDFGGLNWGKATTYDNPYFVASPMGANVGVAYTIDSMCSHYATIGSLAPGKFANGDYDKCICHRVNNVSFMVRDSAYNDSDAASFRTAMSGVQLVYELATPITYQLTPTAVKSHNGVNNVYANTGEIIEGQYFKTL